MSDKHFSYWGLITFVLKQYVILLLLSIIIFLIPLGLHFKALWSIPVFWILALIILIIYYFVFIYPKISWIKTAPIYAITSIVSFFGLFAGFIFTVFLQDYNAGVLKVKYPSEIKMNDSHRYYSIENYFIDTNIVGVSKNRSASRNRTYYKLYHTSPILNDTTLEGNTKNFNVWIGQLNSTNTNAYSKTKDDVFRRFDPIALAQYKSTNFHGTKLFERLNGYDYRHYVDAANQTKLAASKDLIILIPYETVLENRYQNSLSTFLILVALTILGAILSIRYYLKDCQNISSAAKL